MYALPSGPSSAGNSTGGWSAPSDGGGAAATNTMAAETSLSPRRAHFPAKRGFSSTLGGVAEEHAAAAEAEDSVESEGVSPAVSGRSSVPHETASDSGDEAAEPLFSASWSGWDGGNGLSAQAVALATWR